MPKHAPDWLSSKRMRWALLIWQLFWVQIEKGFSSLPKIERSDWHSKHTTCIFGNKKDIDLVCEMDPWDHSKGQELGIK